MTKQSLITKQTLGLYLQEVASLLSTLNQHHSQAMLSLGASACDALEQQATLLAEKACQKAKAESANLHWLQTQLPALRRALAPYQTLLEQCDKSSINTSIRPLTQHALWQKSVQSMQTQQAGQQQVLILAQVAGERAPEQTALEALNLAHITLPTGLASLPNNWLLVAEAFAQKLAQGASAASAFRAQSPLHGQALEAVLSLRLAGPAYYAKRMLLHLYNQEIETAISLAPVLFDALNRYSLSGKDVLILNQALDGLRQEFSGTTPTLNESDLRQLYEIAEHLLPERFTFNEKQLEQSQRLMDRLRNGVLISALPQPHHPEVLEASLLELAETEPIGPLLEQFTEQPASAIQILSTGTFYELEQLPSWTQAMLSEEDNSWATFQAAQSQLSALLKRSLHIAQIHEALAASANTGTTGVPLKTGATSY